MGTEKTLQAKWKSTEILSMNQQGAHAQFLWTTKSVSIRNSSPSQIMFLLSPFVNTVTNQGCHDALKGNKLNLPNVIFVIPVSHLVPKEIFAYLYNRINHFTASVTYSFQCWDSTGLVASQEYSEHSSPLCLLCICCQAKVLNLRYFSSTYNFQCIYQKIPATRGSVCRWSFPQPFSDKVLFITAVPQRKSSS